MRITWIGHCCTWEWRWQCDNSEAHYVNCKRLWPVCVVNCLVSNILCRGVAGLHSCPSIEKELPATRAVITGKASMAAAAAALDSHYRQRSVCVLKSGTMSSRQQQSPSLPVTGRCACDNSTPIIDDYRRWHSHRSRIREHDVGRNCEPLRWSVGRFSRQ